MATTCPREATLRDRSWAVVACIQWTMTTDAWGTAGDPTFLQGEGGRETTVHIISIKIRRPHLRRAIEMYTKTERASCNKRQCFGKRETDDIAHNMIWPWGTLSPPGPAGTILDVIIVLGRCLFG